ncbi:hypothetical protein M406DRAFT_102698 [Cryphonectria parasitica EP155]|uniref:Uncharacterized protein n=1 Tax=Cryphonectria parasitica (strain ATCC 38755 / EP155) TaxID=660469 RepID=A0A9P5CSI0_CRYP1|nr:uncharacterized protein M406DRAFT_102698 [Cryphonectria parasitica EP155]KAF3768351.1 hypothetical protein M406DRAFT_102698 [Cryphonectria parasitica EP155]
MSATTFSWEGKQLSQGADFFDERQPLIDIKPVDYERKLYFRQCDLVTFSANGVLLFSTNGSEEGILPKGIGVRIFRGQGRLG